jgi:hypothetical protein
MIKMLEEEEKGHNRQIVIPTSLEDWTWETMVTLVKKHEFEPGIYDYKDVLHPTGDQKHRDEHNDSIRRTACSMANTSGGFILFGVKDRRKRVDTLEKRIIGIPVQGDLRKEFGDKVGDLQPEIYFDTALFRHPDDGNKGVFVVSIPLSPRRPHMVSAIGAYYKRGDGGSARHMDHYEVREQMLYTEERLQRVMLFRLEIAQYLELIQMLPSDGYEVIRTFYRFDTSAYKVLLADICSLLPASGNLLSLLLKVPLQANMINRRLESVPSSIIDREYVQNFAQQLSDFHKHCTDCQNRLNVLFGPIGADGL